MNNSLVLSSYLGRYIFLNSVDISDFNVFPSRTIANAPPGHKFRMFEKEEVFLHQLEQINFSNSKIKSNIKFDNYLEENGTTAFIIICKNQVLFEKYYNNQERSSLCTSFSTAKSFVSALIGLALQDKLILNLDDPISNYLNELRSPFWSKISIRHLLSMSSGLQYNAAGFFPWNDEPKVYYSLNLRKLARNCICDEEPGNHFRYNNYNLILLGMLIEKVSNGTVSYYLQEKIWKPLGMEYPATWSLDSISSGMEKMESGLNARAIDFAKFGQLYLNRGNWNGNQIIPEYWVDESTTIGPGAKWNNYKYLWWIVNSEKRRYMAVGNLGQFIYIAPDKECVIVRFGRGKPKNWKKVYPLLFNKITEIL